MDESLWFPQCFGRAGRGDSGHPICQLVNGELILLSHYTTVMDGVTHPDHLGDFNDAMKGLCQEPGAPVDRLTVADDLMRLKAE